MFIKMSRNPFNVDISRDFFTLYALNLGDLLVELIDVFILQDQ